MGGDTIMTNDLWIYNYSQDKWCTESTTQPPNSGLSRPFQTHTIFLVVLLYSVHVKGDPGMPATAHCQICWTGENVFFLKIINILGDI